jgi:hypothetical protein
MSTRTKSSWIPWLAAMVPIGLSACNQYEMFLVTGSEQVAFTGKVDVLFVIDNSSSVSDEASALMKNFDNFIDTLAGDDAYGQNTETLTDAVNDYITFTSNRSEAIDYRIAVVTTNLDKRNWTPTGEAPRANPGEAGRFVGTDSVISRGDDAEQERFLQHVGCWSTCWGTLPTDNSYAGVPGDCTFPENTDGEATSQYLECLCVDVEYPEESANWQSNDLCDPRGIEKPIEASLLAMCRATDNPPEICWHTGSALDEPTESVTDTDWYQTNKNWLRDDSKVVVIVITDEGDSSNYALDPAGLFKGSQDEDPTPYVQAFEDLGRDVTFAFIGPDFRYQDGGYVEYCNSGDANSPGAVRMMNLAKATGGFYRPITSGDIQGREACDVADFSVHLEELGKLMMNLQTAFALRAVPEEDSIRVYIDGEQISRASLATTEADGETITFGDAYDDGWSYDPGQNSVLFWGTAVPDYNQDVEIFYRPLDGNPRDLPL